MILIDAGWGYVSDLCARCADRRRHRFPPVIIQHAVWLYCRFTLSYRDVEDLLAERGLDISYETVLSRTRFSWTQNWLNRSVQGGPEHDR